MRTVLAVLAVTLSLLPAQSAPPRGPAAFGDPSPAVTGPYHVLKFAGRYQDLPSLDMSLTSLLGGSLEPGKPFFELVGTLRELADKASSTPLLLDLSDPSLVLNGPQLMELEREFAALEAAGIKTTAYLENAGMPHYRVAMLADRVLMADMGMLDFKAPSLGVLFMKRLLDLVGVEMQVTRCGDFKGAVEPFMLPTMSEHLKAHYTAMVESMNQAILDSVARHRNIDRETLVALQAQRLLSPEAARKAGLVDELVPWRGAKAALALSPAPDWKPIGEKKKKSLSIMSLLTGTGGKRDRPLDQPGLVVLHLSGAIQDGTKEQAGAIVSGPTVALIEKLIDDANVKGVVVRVNSPGGSATASEAVLLALRDLAAKKPVVVSMGELAASGGYYISMVGPEVKVFAEAETITGSIGVFGMRPNIQELASTVGIHQDVVSPTPEAAAMDDIFVPLPESRLAAIQDLVDRIYGRFQDRILEARPLERERLLEIAGGRVWSGVQAKERGLVDQVGGMSDALGILQTDAESPLPVHHRPEIDDNPFAALQSFLGMRLGHATAALTVLREAGFDLAPTLGILAATLEKGTPRAWMMLPMEFRLR